MSNYMNLNEFGLLVSPMFEELAAQCESSITKVAQTYKLVRGEVAPDDKLGELHNTVLALLPNYANELPLLDVVTSEAMETRYTAFDSAIMSSRLSCGTTTDEWEMIIIDPANANNILWVRHYDHYSVIVVATLAQHMEAVELLIASEGQGTIKLH